MKKADPPIKFLSFHSYIRKLTGGVDRYVYARAGTNTPSDEYDTYREYMVANTIRIANTLFLRG